MNSDVVVSIICITYNHEKYIRDAIEGFLHQNVGFQYEIIIHDDASVDNTQNILREYEQKYSEIIHVIYQKENQYSKMGAKMFKSIYNICKGKYVAICEGDDYWIDQNKLQQQVDFMEKHPDYVMICHNALKIDCRTGQLSTYDIYKKSQSINAENLIMQYNGNIPTASIMLKKEITLMPDFLTDTSVGDVPLQLYAITKGEVYYSDRIMSVYRSFGEGSWTQRMYSNRKIHLKHHLQMINMMEQYDEYTNGKFHKYIVARNQMLVNMLFYIYEDAEKEFINECNLCNEQTKYVYDRIIGRIVRVWNNNRIEDYCDVVLFDYLKNKKYVVVFGTGKYGTLMYKQLKLNGININGFVTSDCKSPDEHYMDKPVWNIANIPLNKEQMGVIVAIRPQIWLEVEKKLAQCNINDYICPFMI